MERLWDGETKVCSNGSSHMTKMAAIAIYSKNFKKQIFSGTKRPMTLNLGMHHRVLEYYKFAQIMALCCSTYFTARSNLVPYAFVWEKGKTGDFSETIVVYDLKLATDDRSGKKFLLTSKLCPFICSCHVAIYMY